MSETMARPNTDAITGGSKPIASYGLLSDCNSAALAAQLPRPSRESPPPC